MYEQSGSKHFWNFMSWVYDTCSLLQGEIIAISLLK